ncbi:MAG: hypothetical protein GWN46_01080, partial [Gammaproteobacteria bacterium]|nr:hypothetical protein [Gammaproteobacteria bacterium]
MRHLLRHAVLLLVLGALVAPGCRDSEVTVRPLNLNGPAIAYSGYRDGQSPKTGVLPSQDQVAEDLRILAKNWRLIRVYAADRHGEDVLEVIRREKIDLEVMLGIWLEREPGFEQENAR